MDHNKMDKEEEGLAKMRELNQKFLASGKGSILVREFLTKVDENESVMLHYLRGRKYKPDYAWNTLKRKAEVRFDQYPEVFLNEYPQKFYDIQEKGMIFILKTRDSLGRRIMCFNTKMWNPKEVTIEEITAYAVFFTETAIRDNEIMRNGLIVIQNCDGMGLSHAKYYSLHAMLRFLNIFWYACPIPTKAVYFINLPIYLMFLVELIKPFFSKKFKERLTITTPSKKFTALHAAISPDVLPQSLGGNRDDADTIDLEFCQ